MSGSLLAGMLTLSALCSEFATIGPFTSAACVSTMTGYGCATPIAFPSGSVKKK